MYCLISEYILFTHNEIQTACIQLLNILINKYCGYLFVDLQNTVDNANDDNIF